MNEAYCTISRQFHLLLSYGPVGYVHAVTERFTDDGIHINTGSVSLESDCDVEVLISVPEGDYTNSYSFPATIERSGHAGTVLIPRHRDARIFSLLCDT